MQPISCIIVDDEPLAVEVLENYVARLPKLESLGSYGDAFQAMEALRQQPVSVMFLDINMPGLSGLSLARSLSDPPLLVFTTAYAEHAVEGFELDAVDYLLKPISFERFVQAVEKVSRALQQKPASREEGHLLVRADKKLHRVAWKDILYIEALGDYVKVHLQGQDKPLVSKARLKNLEQKLPETAFLRIHKSYLCGWRFVQYLEGNRLQVGDHLLPVGQTYKEKLLERLG
jgi:two-component system LytT family response regulator